MCVETLHFDKSINEILFLLITHTHTHI